MSQFVHQVVATSLEWCPNPTRIQSLSSQYAESFVHAKLAFCVMYLSWDSKNYGCRDSLCLGSKNRICLYKGIKVNANTDYKFPRNCYTFWPLWEQTVNLLWLYSETIICKKCGNFAFSWISNYMNSGSIYWFQKKNLVCRAGRLEGPARYTSARAKRQARIIRL